MTDLDIIRGADVPALAAEVEVVLLDEDCPVLERATFVANELLRYGMKVGEC